MRRSNYITILPDFLQHYSNNALKSSVIFDYCRTMIFHFRPQGRVRRDCCSDCSDYGTGFPCGGVRGVVSEVQVDIVLEVTQLSEKQQCSSWILPLLQCGIEAQKGSHLRCGFKKTPRLKRKKEWITAEIISKYLSSLLCQLESVYLRGNYVFSCYSFVVRFSVVVNC